MHRRSVVLKGPAPAKALEGKKETIGSIYGVRVRVNGNGRQRWRKLSFIVKERQEETLS